MITSGLEAILASNIWDFSHITFWVDIFVAAATISFSVCLFLEVCACDVGGQFINIFLYFIFLSFAYELTILLIDANTTHILMGLQGSE